MNNSVRLQPPASDLCSPSGRFYSTHISYASLPSVLASTFHQSGREFFFPHQSVFSKHQESLGTKSTLSHRAALDLVLSPHLQPPTNHPGKILSFHFQSLAESNLSMAITHWPSPKRIQPSPQTNQSIRNVL